MGRSGGRGTAFGSVDTSLASSRPPPPTRSTRLGEGFKVGADKGKIVPQDATKISVTTLALGHG